jgi:hypothetical protein
MVAPSPEMRRAIMTDEMMGLAKRGYWIVSQTDDQAMVVRFPRSER